MADVRRAQDRLGEPSDGDRAASGDELLQERERRLDLRPARATVRRLGAGMRRHDVPEQDVLIQAELGEHAVHDRRGRLGRAAARELPLGREGQAADSSAPVTRGLSDQDDRRPRPGLEIGREPLSARPTTAVLVVRIADPGRGQAVYQRVYEGTLDFEQCRRTWSSVDRQDVMWEWLRRNGVPEEEELAMRSFGETYQRLTRYSREPVLVEAGDRVDGWLLIAAPGHADGQLMLLKGGVLIAGDHLLPRISPAIGLWPDSSPDPLGD